MSIPLYKSSNLSLSPLATIRLFSTSVTFFFSYFVSKFICAIFFFFFYITHGIFMVFVLLCLTSLSMTVSRSIHVATNGIICSFLWLNHLPLGISTTSSLSIPEACFIRL